MLNKVWKWGERNLSQAIVKGWWFKLNIHVNEYSLLLIPYFHYVSIRMHYVFSQIFLQTRHLIQNVVCLIGSLES